MKFLKVSVFISILVLGCNIPDSKKPKVDTLNTQTTIKGSFSGLQTATFTITDNNDNVIEVAINDSSFNESIDLNSDGYYMIQIDGGLDRNEVYLKKGEINSFHIEMDSSSQVRLSEFSNSCSTLNEYLSKKQVIINNTRKDIGMWKQLGLQPQEIILNRLEEEKTNKLKLLERFESTIEDTLFRQQKLFIYFEYLSIKAEYLYYCPNDGILKDSLGRLTKKGEGFIAQMNSIDLDNSLYYVKSWGYHELLKFLFMVQKESEYVKDENEHSWDKSLIAEKSIRYLNTLKSNIIKNDLAHLLISDLNISNKHSELLYNGLMRLSIDSTFKEKATSIYDKIKALNPGNPSPTFEYENFNGELTKLSDFKGDYVYIDIWATWCGPCKKEAPFFFNLRNQLVNKNISFVSISVDFKEHAQLWRDYVLKKDPKGINLLSYAMDQSEFMKAFLVSSVPRFILIDPEGKIINANMTRPSDPATIKILNELLDNVDESN